MSHIFNKFAFIICNLLFCINLLGLQIDPLRTMITVDAGKKEVGCITLTNTNNKKSNISVSFENQAIHGDLGKKDWLTSDQNFVVIEPGQQAVLKYEVFISDGVTGELRSRIAFSEVSPDQKEGAVAINTKISVPFFATVKGTEVYDFEVVSFEVKDDAKETANVIIHNRGNVHVRPSGICSISKMGEEKPLQSIQLNKTKYPVFPNEEKEFYMKLNKPLSPGKYTVELQLESITQINHSIRQILEFEVI